MMKASLRLAYTQKRKLISGRERSRLTDLILINFQQISLPFIGCMHTYLATAGEVDTQQIIRYLTFRNPGLVVCIPKINSVTRHMESIVYEEDMEMATNIFGIEEPLKGELVYNNLIDLVVTPLLAFDKSGNRVGYGKGFYDRFFAQCRDDVIKTGLSFFEPEESIEDTNQFDIPLNYCVTPQEVYQF